MKNIVAQTRYEYGVITNRLTAKRVPLLSSSFLYTDFSSMTVNDIYESAPIDIDDAGVYTLYLHCLASSNGAKASVSVIDTTTNTEIASVGNLDFYIALTTEPFIAKLNSFTLLDPKKVHLRISVTGRTTGSLGYKITAGDIVFYKEK